MPAGQGKRPREGGGRNVGMPKGQGKCTRGDGAEETMGFLLSGVLYSIGSTGLAASRRLEYGRTAWKGRRFGVKVSACLAVQYTVVTVAF